MEVLAITRIMELRLNETKHSQLNKDLFINNVYSTTISFLVLILPWILSNTLLSNDIASFFSIAVSVFILTYINSQAFIDIKHDEIEVLENAVEWFEKLKKAYEIMLKACNKKYMWH